MPRRLYLRLVLLLSAGLSATVLAFGWWMGRTQGDALVDAMGENAVVVATAHAESAAHFLVVEEFAGLEAFLHQAAHTPEVLAMRLHDAHGTLLVDIARETEESEPR